MIEGDSNEMTVQVRGVRPWTWALCSVVGWLFVSFVFSGCLPAGDNGEHPPGRGNHPPIVRAVSIHPMPLILSGPLVAIVQAQDDDGDALTFQYRWFANGKLVAERQTESLEPGHLKRGDKVEVEATPSDGKDRGAAHKSEAIVIGNTLPM